MFIGVCHVSYPSIFPDLISLGYKSGADTLIWGQFSFTEKQNEFRSLGHLLFTICLKIFSPCVLLPIGSCLSTLNL